MWSITMESFIWGNEISNELFKKKKKKFGYSFLSFFSPSNLGLFVIKAESVERLRELRSDCPKVCQGGVLIILN